MEFVQKLYDFIIYLINTIRGLVAAIKGGATEEGTTIIPETTGE